MRTYTLSSTPSRALYRFSDGEGTEGSLGTRWMFDNLRPGMAVKAFGPRSAISPMRALSGRQISLHLRRVRRYADDVDDALTLADRSRRQSDVTFVHCARSPDDMHLSRELECTGSRHAATSRSA
jgi:ferredoxin-NADP reductase